MKSELPQTFYLPEGGCCCGALRRRSARRESRTPRRRRARHIRSACSCAAPTPESKKSRCSNRPMAGPCEGRESCARRSTWRWTSGRLVTTARGNRLSSRSTSPRARSGGASTRPSRARSHRVISRRKGRFSAAPARWPPTPSCCRTSSSARTKRSPRGWRRKRSARSCRCSSRLRMPSPRSFTM